MKSQSPKSSIMLAGLTRGAWMGTPVDRQPERCAGVGGADPTARRQRVARQFLVSILRRYGRNAP